MFLIIVLGLIGLGIVVTVHEAGHMVAAKLTGVEVEAFSIGWGPRLLTRTYKGTEYRLSVLPLGGYCKLKGETAFQKALETGSARIPQETGSFYTAPVWKRVAILVSGPLVNLIFAILVLSIIWYAGFSFETHENRIVLASDAAVENEKSPAEEAGLETGDRIIAINAEPVENFRNIQQKVAASPREELELTVQRNGEELFITVVPKLDRQTGAGLLGVYPWIPPVLAGVDGPASVAGLRPGDRILEIDGRGIDHSIALQDAVRAGGSNLHVVYERNGEIRETNVAPDTGETGEARLGVSFETITQSSPSLSPAGALVQGVSETWETLALTVQGIGLLFRGVDLSQAVAGPVRIVYFTGEVAQQGFQAGVGAGFSSLFNFLSLLSVILFFMNLLPIPVLDGGQILMNLVEGVRRKPLSPRAIQRYQMVGGLMILALIVFALMSDFIFLAGR